MDKDTCWLVIRPRNYEASDEVQSYLYASTKVVHVHDTGGYGDVLVAIVIDFTATGRALYLANYQAERLRSGMHGVNVVGSYGEVRQQLAAITMELEAADRM